MILPTAADPHWFVRVLIFYLVFIIIITCNRFNFADSFMCNQRLCDLTSILSPHLNLIQDAVWYTGGRERFGDCEVRAWTQFTRFEYYKCTVQPTAIAEAIPRAARISAMQRMGPIGSLKTKPMVFGFSIGGITPVTLLIHEAISSRYLVARSTFCDA